MSRPYQPNCSFSRRSVCIPRQSPHISVTSRSRRGHPAVTSRSRHGHVTVKSAARIETQTNLYRNHEHLTFFHETRTDHKTNRQLPLSRPYQTNCSFLRRSACVPRQSQYISVTSRSRLLIDRVTSRTTGLFTVTVTSRSRKLNAVGHVRTRGHDALT